MIAEKWPYVNFVSVDAGPDSDLLTGSPVPMRTSLELAGLRAEDVRVEAVVGRVGANGDLQDTQVLTLSPIEQQGTAFLFGRDFAPFATGRLGYSLRVSPNHCDDPLNRPCNSLLKWAGDSSGT